MEDSKCKLKPQCYVCMYVCEHVLMYFMLFFLLFYNVCLQVLRIFDLQGIVTRVEWAEIMQRVMNIKIRWYAYTYMLSIPMRYFISYWYFPHCISHLKITVVVFRALFCLICNTFIQYVHYPHLTHHRLSIISSIAPVQCLSPTSVAYRLFLASFAVAKTGPTAGK